MTTRVNYIDSLSLHQSLDENKVSISNVAVTVHYT